MNNKIGFSTGSVFRYDHSINGQIAILRELELDVIEINYATITDLDEELSKENIDYLLTLDHIFVHAPFFDEERNDFYYEDNDQTKIILAKLEKLHELLKVKTFVFHPNQIKDYAIFENVSFCASIENMPIKRAIDIGYMTELLDENPLLDLVLDTAHALSYSEDMIERFTKSMPERIHHVHLSDRRFCQDLQKMKSHQQLMSREIMEKFRCLQELECPIIIEISVKDEAYDCDNLKKEVAVVKDFFCSTDYSD